MPPPHRLVFTKIWYNPEALSPCTISCFLCKTAHFQVDDQIRDSQPFFFNLRISLVLIFAQQAKHFWVKILFKGAFRLFSQNFITYQLDVIVTTSQNSKLFLFHDRSELTTYITVWPQPIWKKVRTSWQIPPQHQRTYQGGPESASIEIPPFRPKFT